MRSFDPLLDRLSTIPDPRRAEGRVYALRRVLLFSILAVFTGGNSFRSIETFIKVHRRRLNTAFGLRWKCAPCHTGIGYMLQGLDPAAVEQAFREHATGLLNSTTDPSRCVIALDGKTIRGSFDNFCDRKVARVLHAFDTEAGLVLAHMDIEEKSNEIPVAQKLLGWPGWSAIWTAAKHARWHDVGGQHHSQGATDDPEAWGTEDRGGAGWFCHPECNEADDDAVLSGVAQSVGPGVPVSAPAG